MACARDLLFYINCFGWTYNPKDHPDAPERPFITWPYQDEVLSHMASSIGANDLLIEKSRDMGGTWLCLLVMEWRWHFYPGQTFLLVSRIEDLVDKRNEPDCLMWKIDFFHKQLPNWLMPGVVRQKLSLFNKDNDSTITGASTTRETSRGGRKTAILFDEFAMVEDGHSMLSASRDATNCRFLNSTPKGTGNAFHDRREKMATDDPDNLLTLHWERHPSKSAGLYTSEGGLLRIIDTEYRFPQDYFFILDDKLRSPWYDLQCKRAASMQEIAQELDIDYAKSGWQFFDAGILQKLMKAPPEGTVVAPYLTGELDFTEENHKPDWCDREEGQLLLWCHLSATGMPPTDRQYVLGVDIATGIGGPQSSNSAISVVDKLTGEKVAEYTNNEIKPEELASYSVALCNFFQDNKGQGAYLVWEANGAGGQFGKTIIEIGYHNFFCRQNERQLVNRRTNIPGWWTQGKNKRLLLGEYGRALKQGYFINRSKQALEECGQYVHQPSGDIVHMRGSTAAQAPEHGENHGDIVIADALAWRGVQDRPSKKQDTKEPTIIPMGSYGHRQQVRGERELEAKKEYSW
jgi:hypothetical protein